MKVRCVSNIAEAMPQASLDADLSGTFSKVEYYVTPGREYFVYGVTIFLGIAWYYIIDDVGNAWPIWYPCSMFEVVDGRLPASWLLGYFRFDREVQETVLSFPEWASDFHFYERLTDLDPTTVATFERRRKEVEALDEPS
jgi:hypothetical protein